MLREALKRILASEFTDASFGKAANTTVALAQLWQKPWELVLLDVSMRGRSGLAVLKEVRASPDKVPVLVLSAHPKNNTRCARISMTTVFRVRLRTCGS